MRLLELLGLFGALALGSGYLLATRVRTSRRRVLLVLLGGLVAIAAVFGGLILAAPTSVEACRSSDCGKYMGHWFDPLLLFSAGFNVYGWIAGVAAAMFIRIPGRRP